MGGNSLGRTYEDGEIIVRQGEIGDCMYIVQEGEVQVVVGGADAEVSVGVLKPGEAFGEMALFTREPRSATVRARGKARVLTIDKRQFLKRIQEDPSLAFGILRKLSENIQALNVELQRLRR